MTFAAAAGSSFESASRDAWWRARAKVSFGAGRWCWSSLVGCPTRMQLPPGSVIRNCRMPYDMSFSGPIRGSPRVGIRPYAPLRPARNAAYSPSTSSVTT